MNRAVGLHGLGRPRPGAAVHTSFVQVLTLADAMQVSMRALSNVGFACDSPLNVCISEQFRCTYNQCNQELGS